MMHVNMSGSELTTVKEKAKTFNNMLKAQKRFKRSSLGKNDFLKLLVTELRHQDPTSPMKDRDFMAQMAQFSSLEQMKNMTEAMNSMNIHNTLQTASSLLGRTITTKDNTFNGTIDAVKVINNETVLFSEGRAVRMDNIGEISK